MSNTVKENAILQLTKMLIESGKNINEYNFEDCDVYNIYLIKNNGLKMIISLLGFKVVDVIGDVHEWQMYKTSVLDKFHKLESIYLTTIDAHKENESIDMLCKVDIYLSQSLLEHFIKEKGTIRIIDPTMFSNVDMYIISLRNLDTFKRFIESKIFFKVKSVIN
jgi:hypothetical protein